MTPIRAGNSVSENTVSLVRYPASFNPGVGGAAARAPVQMAAFAKVRVRFPADPSTWMASELVNRPLPIYTSTPNFVYRWAESFRLIRARNFRIRAMTAPKSYFTPAGTWRPNSAALRRSAHALAARIIPFDGTHPTFKQSPPIKCFSINATLAPRLAAITAVINPAVPAPMTTMLYRPAGSGLTQLPGWTLATSC